MKFPKFITRWGTASSTAPEMAPHPLVVLGSSVSEQFDYIFGDHPDYHPFWASAWTARNLLAPKGDQYLETIMDPIPRHANVFLSFGSMDVNFAAQRIANAPGKYDRDRFLQTTVDGIIHANDTLVRMGFDQVRAAFIAPVVDLPDAYWKELSVENQLPTAVRARMIYDLAINVGHKMPTLNVLDEMIISPDTPIAKPALMRAELEHHVDYIAAQDIVWNAIKDIAGMLPKRKSRHRVLYPHTAHWAKDLRDQGITRPKTCF